MYINNNNNNNVHVHVYSVTDLHTVIHDIDAIQI